MHHQEVCGLHKDEYCIGVIERRDAMQKDFERLENWTSGNLKINKAKCKVLYHHWKKLQYFTDRRMR